MQPCLAAAQRRWMHCSCTQQLHPHRKQRSVVLSRAYGCYTAYMPLVGLEALGFLLQHPLAEPVQHRAVILGDKDKPKEGCVVIDFLPLDATSPVTAVKLLSGQRAQGTTRIRKLGRFLNGTGIRTEWAGAVHPSRSRGDPLDDVRHFNNMWDHQLHLVDNNCVHYTEAILTFFRETPSAGRVDDSCTPSLQNTLAPSDT